MKTRSKNKSRIVIVLLAASACGLGAQVPGDPTVSSPEVEATRFDSGAIASPPDASAWKGPVEQALIDAEPVDPGLSDDHLLIRRRLTAKESGPWTAAQATGAPNTPQMGDISSAWAAAMADAGEEWLRVQFNLEADLDRVRVVQSFNPGAITKVTAENKDGQAVTLREVKSLAESGTPANTPVVAEFVPPDGTTVRTTTITITIDERKVPGWNEIDAVEIVSRNGDREWGHSATASSSFGDSYSRTVDPTQGTASAPAVVKTRDQIARLEQRFLQVAGPLSSRELTAASKGRPWSPEQATGEPDTPLAGDYPTAWAPLTYQNKEWLDLTFPKPADVRELRIVESSNTRAITAAKAYMNGALVPLLIRKEETAHAPADAVPAPVVPGVTEAEFLKTENPGADRPHIVVAAPENAVLPAVQKVRIELDSAGLSTWPEIDAVELVGTDGSRQWAASAGASSTYAQRTVPYETISRGYERANSLEEANQRIDLLTQRLEKLERELERTKAINPSPWPGTHSSSGPNPVPQPHQQQPSLTRPVK